MHIVCIFMHIFCCIFLVFSMAHTCYVCIYMLIVHIYCIFKKCIFMHISHILGAAYLCTYLAYLCMLVQISIFKIMHISCIFCTSYLCVCVCARACVLYLSTSFTHASGNPNYDLRTGSLGTFSI